MKNLLHIAILSIVLVSCGGGGGTPTPEPTPENKVPTIPNLESPADNLLCIDNSVNFKWTASTDPNGDSITYQIQVAKDNLFTQIAHTLTGTALTKTISLEKGISYYWRVKATDSKNGSSEYSTIYKFYTEGEGLTNHLPFSPTLVAPALNSVVQTTTATLEWTGSDSDTNDTLTYDVYFGTVNPPIEIVSSNQTTTTYSVTVDPSTNYFWKIDIKDNHGGQTDGQIWNFKTD
jgi:hypothetical protein